MCLASPAGSRRELPRVALRVKRNTQLLFRTTAKQRGKERKGKERREGERKRGDPPPYQQAFPPHPRLQRLRHRREAIYRATLSRYRRARTYARRTLTTLYIYNGARFALSAPVSLGSLAAQHEPEKRAGACFTAKCARCTHTCSPPPPHDDHVLLLSLFLSIYLYIAHSRARARVKRTCSSRRLIKIEPPYMYSGRFFHITDRDIIVIVALSTQQTMTAVFRLPRR